MNTAFRIGETVRFVHSGGVGKITAVEAPPRRHQPGRYTVERGDGMVLKYYPGNWLELIEPRRAA